MRRKILLGIGSLVMLVGAVILAATYSNGLKEPPLLVANFVDLDQVRRISKFRSCAGHTTVPQDGRETKRSMKHYISLFPEYQKEDLVEIYAPYDGSIALAFGEELWIAPERQSWLELLPINRWMLSVTHVKPKPGLGIGDTVKAGELIGYGTFAVSEPGYPAFDVTYGTMHIPPKKIDHWISPYGDLDSVFNHLSDEVLAQYEQRGVTRENIIMSQEARDRDPCVYKDDGPYFEYKNGSIDSVELN